MISENVGYAVGDAGTILKTTNGGSDWIRINSINQKLFLKSVDFINNNFGFYSWRIWGDK